MNACFLIKMALHDVVHNLCPRRVCSVWGKSRISKMILSSINLGG